MTKFEQSIESGYAIGVLLGVFVVFFFAGIVFLQGHRERAHTTVAQAATQPQGVSEQVTETQITQLLERQANKEKGR